MIDQPVETISVKELQLARQGDTDVIPVPRTRAIPAIRTANLVQIGPAGPGLGRRFPLGLASITLGRESQCSLTIFDGSVSRMHAVIEPRSDGSYRLSDLNSRNGTFVNGVRVSEAELSDGDYVQLGECVYRFLAGGNVEAGYHDEIHRLTTLDPLTGVHNRRSLNEFLEREVGCAVRLSRPIAVLLLDADHFKLVNDRHGHPVGDAVLRGLAERLRQRARAEDLVARYGGEEFAVVLPETDLAMALVIGERFRVAVAEEAIFADGIAIGVTVSVGVAALAAGESRTTNELLQVADERLYEAKRAGRNRVIPVPPRELAPFSACVETPPPIGATREFQL